MSRHLTLSASRGTWQPVSQAPVEQDLYLGARQLLDHALAGPLPLLQKDEEIGHLLPVRPLVELPDEVGADLTTGVRTSARMSRDQKR
jgi:hypothetical protein